MARANGFDLIVAKRAPLKYLGLQGGPATTDPII